MQTLDTSARDTIPVYEAPAGRLARVCALGVAVGFSVLVGAMLFAIPDLAAAPLVWFIWSFVTLTSIAVYTVGTVMFRRSTPGPSRRMHRWLTTTPS